MSSQEGWGRGKKRVERKKKEKRNFKLNSKPCPAGGSRGSRRRGPAPCTDRRCRAVKHRRTGKGRGGRTTERESWSRRRSRSKPLRPRCEGARGSRWRLAAEVAPPRPPPASMPLPRGLKAAASATAGAARRARRSGGGEEEEEEKSKSSFFLSSFSAPKEAPFRFVFHFFFHTVFFTLSPSSPPPPTHTPNPPHPHPATASPSAAATAAPSTSTSPSSSRLLPGISTPPAEPRQTSPE